MPPGITIISDPAAPPEGSPAPVVTQTPGGGASVTPPLTQAPAPSITEPPAPTTASPAVSTPKIEAPSDKPATINLSAAVAEAGKDGKVSEATYKAAEAKGLSRADVDTYVQGHKARVEGVANKLSKVAGGADSLKAVMEWASANTDAATRDAFNKAVDGADTTTASLMLRGLVAQYNDSVGVDGARVTGGVPATGAQPYANWNQVYQDMRKPDYNNDPAYRAKVTERLRVSRF